ncbi:hypothetical protein X975_17430, partial [Stegodyphus mimosarum]
MCWRSSLVILFIWIGPETQEEVCAVGMSKSDSVKEGCTTIVIYFVNFCST